ncbi:serine/threonine protein kinase [Fusarium oxysporum f. sp. melonis 26406]|nr:serine/threonine protein kinase [Fusarium oxysporum f. sp. melonis 26406]
MEFYHLSTLAQSKAGCNSRLHIQHILDATYPRVDEAGDNFFAEYERREREGGMFFSVHALMSHFSQPATLDQLLSCKCKDCSNARNVTNYKLPVADFTNNLRQEPLFLALMVYLGKLHYIYFWIKWGVSRTSLPCLYGCPNNNQPRLRECPKNNQHCLRQCPNDNQLERLLRPGRDVSIFRTIYNRALEMFSPVVIEIPESEVCPYLECHELKRFPYLEEKSCIREGSFGAMKKLEIMSDYLHPTMRKRMKPYSTNEKLLFALKSVKIIPDAPLMNMERDVLSMVSRINDAVSENIITLMACYKWKESMHFLFPFVDADLSDLLRNNNSRCPPHLREKLKAGEALLDHWLWQQMEGVSRALSAFHTQMENPFKDVKGKVIALHFDLKPANILVTSGPDGVTLKITDFGQSIIQIIDDDMDISLPHNTGHPRYGPPESRPSSQHLTQGSGDDLKVLLNYDVWSLGCIMVEVLIHLLDEDLNDFDSKLQGPFYIKEPNGLKKCVTDSFRRFEQAFQHDSDQTEYMKDIVALLQNMLNHDKNNRAYSSTVTQKLDEARGNLEALRDGRNQLVVAVEKQGFKDWKGFRKLGWHNGTSIVSFSEKEGITLHLIRQRTGEPVYKSTTSIPCRISLWARTIRTEQTQTGIEIGLVWAVEKGVPPEVGRKNFDPRKWCFAPTYVFPDPESSTNRFDCILFPEIGTTTPGDDDFVFKLGFPSLEDVLIFQGALFQRSILPPISISISTLKPKREAEAPKINQQDSYLQFWAPNKPKYVGPLSTDGKSDRTKPRGSIDSSSTGLSENNRRALEKPFETMVILFKHHRPLVFTLKKGLIKLSRCGSTTLQIDNRVDNSIHVRHPPIYQVWESEDPRAAPRQPCLPVEPEIEKLSKCILKTLTIRITLTKEQDFELFQKVPQNLWKK